MYHRCQNVTQGGGTDPNVYEVTTSGTSNNNLTIPIGDAKELMVVISMNYYATVKYQDIFVVKDGATIDRIVTQSGIYITPTISGTNVVVTVNSTGMLWTYTVIKIK